MIKELVKLRRKSRWCEPIKIEDTLSSQLTGEPSGPSWDDEVIETVHNLLDTAYELEKTVGCNSLSSVQIWDKDTPPPAVAVIKIPNPENPTQFKFAEFINPQLEVSGASIIVEESCNTSNYLKKPKRKLLVKISFQTLSNTNRITINASNSMLGILAQHEMGHLLGEY